jgi:NitT/TauT family transport system substrate-binding protein
MQKNQENSSNMKWIHQLIFAFLTIMTMITIFATRSYAQSLATFRVANGTSGENPAVLWVGVDQGIYRKHGLNVEVIFMRTGPLAMAALASGDVSAVLTSSNNVLNLAAGGVDVVAIATLINKPEGDLMARPEIKKADELRGKTVAIQSIGGGGWANNMLALDHLGLDPDRDKINFLVLGDQASRIQALETNRAQASWMGPTFSAPLKKKGYTVLLDLGHAPISYLGASLIARRATFREEQKLYESMLQGTLDAMRFFLKPENKAAVLKSIARVLRLPRIEDAEAGYKSLLESYSADLKPKTDGVKKIYSILARVNPKLQGLKPESIIDDSLIQKIHAAGY